MEHIKWWWLNICMWCKSPRLQFKMWRRSKTVYGRWNMRSLKMWWHNKKIAWRGGPKTHKLVSKIRPFEEQSREHKMIATILAEQIALDVDSDALYQILHISESPELSDEEINRRVANFTKEGNKRIDEMRKTFALELRRKSIEST